MVLVPLDQLVKAAQEVVILKLGPRPDARCGHERYVPTSIESLCIQR